MTRAAYSPTLNPAAATHDSTACKDESYTESQQIQLLTVN